MSLSPCAPLQVKSPSQTPRKGPCPRRSRTEEAAQGTLSPSGLQPCLWTRRRNSQAVPIGLALGVGGTPGGLESSSWGVLQSAHQSSGQIGHSMEVLLLHLETEPRAGRAALLATHHAVPESQGECDGILEWLLPLKEIQMRRPVCCRDRTVPLRTLKHSRQRWGVMHPHSLRCSPFSWRELKRTAVWGQGSEGGACRCSSHIWLLLSPWGCPYWTKQQKEQGSDPGVV